MANRSYTGANAEQRERKLHFCLELLGNKCCKCGSSDNLVFHHEEVPEFRIAGSLTLSVEKLTLELEKCILVCHTCHWKEHTADHGYNAFATGRCSCDTCHDEYLDYWEDYRRKTGIKVGRKAEHGTRSKYTAGCRCSSCCWANTAYARTRR